MYTSKQPNPTGLKINKSKEGEMIEIKIDRLVNNGEPIKEKNVQLIYQNREEGVKPDYDIRTDKMEHAMEAMDYMSKSHRGKRNQRIADAKKNMDIEKKTENEIKNDPPGNNGGQSPAATNDSK